MMTGVGGQGIQLASQILAQAAVLEGREVMTLGTYGGTMRGGNTDNTIVVADGPIHSPPVVARVGIALAMHHQFFAPIASKLRDDAIVVVNSSVFEGPIEEPGANRALRPFDVPAVSIANEAGSPMAASLALISAFARLSGFVRLDSLAEAMRNAVPSYRSQMIESNRRVLEAAWDAVPGDLISAWPETGATS